MTQRDGQSNAADGAEIVSLWQHQAKTEHSALADMRSYWEALRCGRLVPLRSEIDPREISGALEYGFILERIQPGAVRFRLAGMHLCDLMGMEVRGMPLRSFISPTSRAGFSAVLDRAFTAPQVQEHYMVSEDSNGAKLNARLLILPLKSDSGTVDRAIGCLTTDGVVGLAPRRFRILETRTTDLISGQETRAKAVEDAAPVAPMQTAGFAEPQDSYTPAPPADASDDAAPAKPRLRLVVSNPDDT